MKYVDFKTHLNTVMDGNKMVPEYEKLKPTILQCLVEVAKKFTLHWKVHSRHFSFYHIDKVTAEYRFYGAKTTEQSHQQKYNYSKAQAEIFDRITPFLTGRMWTKFLKNGLFDSLKHDKNNEDERFKSALSL